jgi:peptidyl-prolyl cis-trans isomerase SurA
MKLANLNAGGTNSQLADSQRAEILESLVQERLQINTAKNKKVTVTDKDVEVALEGMAKENNMTAQQLVSFLQTNGISKETLANRVRAQIYWMKYIRQQFGPVIHVSDMEVEKNLKKIDTNKGQKEYLLSEIMLYSSLNDAQDLVSRIRSGAKFAALAKELSKSNTAEKGGELSWMPASGLEPSVAEAILQLRTGQISNPIKVSSGYKIIMLRDVRVSGETSADDMEITLTQALIPLFPDSTEAEIAEHSPRIEELMQTTGCAAFNQKAQSSNIKVQEAKSVHLNQFPEQLKNMIKTAPLGKTTQPIMTPDGLIITMVCAKKKLEPVIITKDDIMSELEQRKYGERAAREMQRLMTTACIECKDNNVQKLLKR